MLQWKIVQQILLRFLKRGALKENFSSNKTESIRFIHHITAKPSLAFTTQTLEANVFQERVRAEVVECGCVIELPELKDLSGIIWRRILMKLDHW
ncbi:hypothetical protein GLYMA_14G109700v4 [Glycine max]|uniref:Uncharacterized protein n=1 Tax=Glycine max TaxID=3847 RepID=A0A0R0GLQ1_SOYBN|nr:hypothetical protein GYH30_039678 [Glycine max]KRH15765.1 hypothetical protein GLYMA_14G109700v4 [Glycine max]